MCNVPQSPQTTVKRIIKYFKDWGDDPVVNEVYRIINAEKFLFKELSKSAQLKAARFYRKDYNETTSNNMTIKEAIDCCKDCDDDSKPIYYTKKGEQINE